VRDQTVAVDAVSRLLDIAFDGRGLPPTRADAATGRLQHP
jgi:hypothetical protein